MSVMSSKTGEVCKEKPPLQLYYVHFHVGLRNRDVTLEIHVFCADYRLQLDGSLLSVKL